MQGAELAQASSDVLPAPAVGPIHSVGLGMAILPSRTTVRTVGDMVCCPFSVGGQPGKGDGDKE